MNMLMAERSKKIGLQCENSLFLPIKNPNFTQMKKKKFNLGDILLIVFLVLLLIPQTRKPIQITLSKVRMLILSPSAVDNEGQVQVTPFAYSVTRLDGTATAIPIGKGRITFLSYWATWCPPCIAELPSIQELYADYGGKIDFLLLTNEQAQPVEVFLEKKEYTLPVYYPKMEAPAELYSKSIPTNYIIDATGKIIVKETGAVDWNSSKTRALLDTLLLN